jgi:hypothetical protein
MTENTLSPLNNVITIDGERIKSYLDRVVRGGVEETLNALLDAEADRLCNAQRYERHAHGATRADGLMAHELTQHILTLFGTAMLRYRQGIPDRCKSCGSYQFELWADEPGVPLKPRCQTCGWIKTENGAAD